MFSFAVRKIDFDKIDFVKLILVKIDFKLKWFMFVYIYIKISWIKNSNIKINFRKKATIYSFNSGGRQNSKERKLLPF
jgi:hypothetical protein